VSWRESAEIAMGQYARGCERFFCAMSILRNKITRTANNAVTHSGTVLNFDLLSEGKLSIMEYYGLVNKKLTLLINKTIITYGRNKPLTAEMNEKHNKTALRVRNIFYESPRLTERYGISTRTRKQ